MKVIAISDNDTAAGLQLAGVQTVYVPTEDKPALHYWHQIEENIASIGIILITEEIADQIGKELNDFRLRNIIPIIVEIPDKKGRRPDHVDYISYLIKKAVGMDIKR